MIDYLLDHHRSIQYLLSSLINLIGDEPVPVSTLPCIPLESPKKVQASPVALKQLLLKSCAVQRVLDSSRLGQRSLSRYPLDRHR